MILPDGTGGERTGSGATRTGLFVVAGLVVVGGFAAMGVLSPAEPVAVVETTTTSTVIAEVEPPIDTENFTVAQIAQGDPLDWEPVMILDDSYPLALIDHQGWIYLFSTEQPHYSGFEEGGLRAWRSEDGESWEPLGQVIPESHRISRVSSTPQGLVAVEDTDNDDGFAVWESDFGFDWTVEEVTVAGLGPGEAVVPQAVGGSEVVLVVAGHSYVDVHRRITESFTALGGEDVVDLGFGWSIEVTGEDVRFPLYGPLGLSLAVLTPADIGLTDAEVEAVVDAWNGREPSARVWTRIGEGPWQETEIPGAAYVETIMTTPDGELIALGHGNAGPTTWSSVDALSWEKAEAFQGPYELDNWRGRLVGAADTGRASVVLSGEDGNWKDIGPRDSLPTQFSWHIRPVGAGPGGIAALVTSWDRYLFEPEEPMEPVLVTDGDAVLALDFEAGSFSLETGHGTSRRWTMHGAAAPEGVAVDLAASVIEFHNPDTGELLATFTIEDIMQAEISYWSGHREPAAHRALAFTTDGEEWTIQDGSAFGEDLEIMHLEVTETHVIAAGIDPAGLYHSTLSPGFALWSARIP